VHNWSVATTDVLDLSGFRLHSGGGRRLELELALDSLELAGQTYLAQPGHVGAILDIARTSGGGYSLRLRFDVAIAGPCMRCLGAAAPTLRVDAREVDLPGGDEELDSPYLTGDLLDLRSWAHDGFALAAPEQILCTADCPGLCPVCAVALRDAGAGHHHDSAPDRRWAKLAELRLE
jgi:uncharacterized protein